MLTIETSTDLIKWSKEVNSALNNKICDYQDIFARSDMKTLKDTFLNTATNSNDFNLVIFSIQKAMGSEALTEYMKFYARRKAEDYIAEEMKSIEERWSEVLSRENAFELKKDQLEATIKNHEQHIKELKKYNQENLKQISAMSTHNMDLKDKIAEMQIELDELYIFEKHIKKLLKGD